MKDVNALIRADHLEHHGILGQKWGIRRGTSYPLDKSQYSAEQKRLNGVSKSEARGAMKAKKAAQKAELAKQKAAKAEAKKEEAVKKEKDKLVKSRNISKILKNADKFTDDELRTIKNRLQLEKELKNVDDTFATKGKKFVERLGVASDVLGKTATVIQNGSNAYNNVAKVLNSMTDSDLPIIGDKKEKLSAKVTTELERENGKVTSNKVTTELPNGNKTVVNDKYTNKKDDTNEKKDYSKPSKTTVNYDEYGWKTSEQTTFKDKDGNEYNENRRYKSYAQAQKEAEEEARRRRANTRTLGRR